MYHCFAVTSFISVIHLSRASQLCRKYPFTSTYRRLKTRSVIQKYTPKNATVTVTTIVVDHTSRRDGQLTCRISTRTSCKKLRKCFHQRPTLPTGSISEKPLTFRSFSRSSRFVLIASAIL